MAYVSLDADGVQDIIDNLTAYQEQADSSKQSVYNTDFQENFPAEIDSYYSNTKDYCDTLGDEIASLQARLDAAKAANEGGITMTAEDGTIAYWLPEGVEDTAENVTTYNQVDKVNQARADAQALVDYSINGCSPEEWDELIQRVQAGQADAVYANTILANIGPARLLDLPTDIQDQFTTKSDSQGVTVSDRPNAGTDLADALGHVLATASLTWDDEKATTYANRLVNYAEQKGKDLRIASLNRMLAASRQADIDGDGAEENIGLNYHDALLLTLANRLENFSPEQAKPWESEFWNPTSATKDPVGSAANPLAGLVHAMTGNPDAAMQWTVPATDTNTPVTAAQSVEHAKRIQKLIETGGLDNQSWTTDWAMLANQIDRTTTPGLDPAQQQFQDSARATATSSILNGLGSGTDPLNLSTEARQSVAAVMARHPQGVDASTDIGNSGGPVGSSVDGDNTTYYPLFTDRALTNLIGQVSLDQWASTHLGEAMTDYHTQQLQDAVNQYNATRDATALQDAVTAQSRTNGFFTGASAHQLVAMAKKQDSASEDANTIASSLAGLIPVIGPAASLGVSLDDPFGTDNAKTASNNAVHAGNTAAAANNRQLTLALLNSGLYTPEDLKATLKREGTSVNALKVIDQDGNNLTQNMTPQQLTDYDFGVGLSEIGDNLYSPTNPDLNLTNTREDEFEKGYGVANPEGDDEPDGEW